MIFPDKVYNSLIPLPNNLVGDQKLYKPLVLKLNIKLISLLFAKRMHHLYILQLNSLL